MRRIITLVVLGIAMVMSQPAAAQDKNIENQHLMWFGLNTNFELKKNWSIGYSIQDRRFVFPGKQHHLITDLKVAHKFVLANSQSLSVGAGMVFFVGSSDNPEVDNDFYAPEYRPHASVTYNFKPLAEGKLKLNFRVLAEQRIRRNVLAGDLADGYFYQTRIRFMLKAAWQLLERDNDKLFLVAYVEPMIQAGDNTTNNIYDHVRNYGALKYQFSKRAAAEVGYMYWYQKVQGGALYWSRHIVVWTLHYTIKKPLNTTITPKF